MATIFGGTKKFWNHVSYSEELPCGLKISSKSFYLALFLSIFVLCIFEKKLKIQNGRHLYQVKYLLKLGKVSLHR